ncbi:MAG: type I-B CRISPR-associated protein Cas7/Cst2/DevR [Clostridia bacterium]|nr:type I-B CRISPR-associated protein Cas7/Cst2/DevR [Clostridia bacterium]
MEAKGITATVVFESSAVNRDEKISGNTASIKKLSRIDGTYSFMSRAFIRHHMFESLNKLYDWHAAPVELSKNVIQFSFPDANVVTYPEMDFFGFMSTVSDTAARKAPLGITKAVSLEPWQGDMAFYANHDMVRRAMEGGKEKATPDPHSKEEHFSYYKVSFTLDLQRIGLQDLYFEGELKNNIKNWMENLPEAEQNEVEEKAAKEDKAEGGFQWRRIEVDGNLFGYVGIKAEDKYSLVRFITTKEEFKKRIEQVLTIIKDGIFMHSSTENYGIKPVFMVAAALKLPVPIFNSSIKLIKNSNVYGLDATPILKDVENSYVIKSWYWSNEMLPVFGSLKDKVAEWESVKKILEEAGIH